ncbi:MAG: hypothetical protein QM323_01565 [Acidobacteriota bacterium]|nr:hypothetical protein [Acidobacteriota bacterium]
MTTREEPVGILEGYTAARTEQAALLARYLAGEVGPFVEEAS